MVPLGSPDVAFSFLLCRNSDSFCLQITGLRTTIKAARKRPTKLKSQASGGLGGSAIMLLWDRLTTRGVLENIPG